MQIRLTETLDIKIPVALVSAKPTASGRVLEVKPEEI
jgi:hypothetical protein